MTRVLTFACLFALQFVIGHCCLGPDERDVYICTATSALRLKAPEADEKVVKCLITTNVGETYEVFPAKEFGSFGSNENQCGFDAGAMKMSHIGVWTMETVTAHETFNTKFIIKMKQDAPIRPTTRISAAVGQWATVWIDSDKDDVTVCNLTKTRGEQYNILDNRVEDMTRVHGCGIRMLVSKEMEGQWEIYAQYGEYLIKRSTFQINVPYENEDKEVLHEEWQIGQRGRINWLSSHLGVLFCQLTRPDGTKVPLIFGSCNYEVPAVSVYHSGVWEVTYAKAEKMELENAKIHVTTSDPNMMEVSVSRGVGQAMNLLCRTGKIDLEFCTFTRPDEHIINVPVGVGNDNYSYYGQGYQVKYSTDLKHAECGLTIHEPSTKDFGLWTCAMRVDGAVRGAVIELKNSRAAEQVRIIDNSPVFVKRGKNFKVACSANTVLNYCWLTSPNGTAYSVSPLVSTEKTLMYDGKGFAMGQCGAIVEEANDDDDGNWICHLGIDGGAEIKTTVAVKVTDTYLIANGVTVYAHPHPKLSCRIFFDDDNALRYCRWVRPNGHGIDMDEAWRFELQQGKKDCSLTILSLESEDLGRWQCVGSLFQSPGREEWANLDLVAATEDGANLASVLSIVLGSGLLVITLIGAFFAAMHFYKRRNARIIKNPPPYYPQDYVLPHGIQTGTKSPIESKDYAY